MSARPGGQQRNAIRTFLIADIRGYTSFTAQRGDEAASRLAMRFAEVAAEGIEAWGGMLVELRGDEALAAFDSARAALRAAAELQAAFSAETRGDPDLPLAVGIGLDVGEAVVVGDGFRGAALNMAARLCAIAGPGEIHASQAVVQLAGPTGGLDIVPVEPLTLKGVPEPVQAYRVAARDGTPTNVAPPERLEGGPPLPPELDPIVPLAGRASELRWLGWHWRRARHGDGRAVVVSGIPGIGKTRLAAEVAARAHAAGAVVRYLPGAEGADDAALGALFAAGASTFVVIDDLDAAGRSLQAATARLGDLVAGRPAMLLVTHRREAAGGVLDTVAQLAPAEHRIELGPLEPAAVRAIAALYAGTAVDTLALEDLATNSGGVPLAIHRLASRLAREHVSHRLSTSVGRTEARRRDLRSAEHSLVGDVTDHELVRERSRLYGADRDVSQPGSGVPICPYKGLATFELRDAEYFFGRERLVGELVARLVGNAFLGLVGASGSGKSSALRAGLLPALAGGVLPASERWTQVVMRPGEHPMAALATALPARPGEKLDGTDPLAPAISALGPDQELLLVVDQFEEVFGATRDEAERGAFIELLTVERPRLKVIVTLRADHYGHCAAYPQLARALATSHVLVGPLTRAELVSVVEHPAERVGLRVEPALTEALVRDAGEEPGVLPLLSTSLLELWQAREDGYLTLAAYRASGGMQGAVARLAEAAYAELDPGQQAVTRSILLRLAGPGEGEGVVRRRVAVTELDTERDPLVARTVDRLTAARLLTSGDGYVEVAHEALLREWPRVRAWLEEDAAGRRLRLHLMGAARDWEARGREPGDLYRGPRLAAALDWAHDHQVDLNAVEREFLGDSRLASERDAEKERRTNRRLRTLLVGASLLLVVALGAGGFAFVQADLARQQASIAADREREARAAEDQARTAEDQARTAEDQAIAAQEDAEHSATLARSRELTASAQAALADDPSLAKLLAVAGASLVEPDLPTERTLHEAWARDRVVDRIVWPGDHDFLAELDPAGDLIVASFPAGGSEDEHIEVMDRQSREVIWRWAPPPHVTVGKTWFSVDGTAVVASTGWDPGDEEPVAPLPEALGVHVWDARTGDLLRRFDAGGCGGEAMGISERWLLTNNVAVEETTADACFIDGPLPIVLVDLVTGERRVIAEEGFDDAAISRDGRYLAATEPDFSKAYVLEIETGRRVLEIDPASTGQLNSFVRGLSHDGGMLLYGDRPMQTWDVAERRVVASLGGTSGESFSAAFALEGETVYASTRDGVLRRYDARTGAEILAVPAVGGGHASLSGSGISLVLDEATRTSSVVDERPTGEIDTFRPDCRLFTGAGTLHVVDATAAFATQCQVLPTIIAETFVLDVPALRVRHVLPGLAAQVLALSKDGTRIAQQEYQDGSVSSPIRIRDTSTATLAVELEGVCTWDQQGLSRDLPAGCEAFPTTPFRLWTTNMAWSPDGRYVAAVHEFFPDPAYLAVWDAATGRLVHTEATPEELTFQDVVFSPDSQRLIWFTGDFGDRGEVEMVSTDDWSVIERLELPADVEGAGRVGFAGFLADGTLSAVSNMAGNGGGWLIRLDAETFALLDSDRAHEGAPKATATSPDGSLVATGASDGVVRVWDGPTGRLVHELAVEGQAQGVAFLGDDHLAVTPHGGGLLVFTLDRAELVDIVAGSLTRGFTEAECDRFGFGDACPSLDELRAGTMPTGRDP